MTATLSELPIEVLHQIISYLPPLLYLSSRQFPASLMIYHSLSCGVTTAVPTSSIGIPNTVWKRSSQELLLRRTGRSYLPTVTALTVQ